MMIRLLFFSLCFDLVFSSILTSLNYKVWQNYKSHHEKFYENPLMDSMRMKMFNENHEYIEQFNREISRGFRMGLNHLSDWTNEELQNLYGYKSSAPLVGSNGRNSIEAEKYIDSILAKNISVPDEFDWRDFEGRVTDVKNQGLCSSCWAFSTTGVLEGQLNVLNKSLIGLSEQNLIDCSRKKNQGCSGGTMAEAMIFIREENGIDDDEHYPYEGMDNDCRFNLDSVAMTDSGAALLTEGDEEELRQIVVKFGPVSIAVDASGTEFSHYKSGVYYNDRCSNSSYDVNHGMLVVGYGRDFLAGDYWLVKNSWGKSFGEDGYIRMARNRDNNCGIASAAIIPIF